MFMKKNINEIIRFVILLLIFCSLLLITGCEALKKIKNIEDGNWPFEYTFNNNFGYDEVYNTAEGARGHSYQTYYFIDNKNKLTTIIKCHYKVKKERKALSNTMDDLDPIIKSLENFNLSSIEWHNYYDKIIIPNSYKVKESYLKTFCKLYKEQLEKARKEWLLKFYI